MAEENKKTVFIVNKGAYDITQASEYGRVQFLSEGSMHPHSTSNMYRQFSLRLANSTAEDFLLISGLTQMTAVAVAILSYKHGRVNFLIYDKRKETYIKRTIVLSNLVDIDVG